MSTKTTFLSNATESGDVVWLQCNTYRSLHVLCVQDSKTAIKFQRSEIYWLLYVHNMRDMDRFPARVLWRWWRFRSSCSCIQIYNRRNDYLGQFIFSQALGIRLPETMFCPTFCFFFILKNKVRNFPKQFEKLVENYRGSLLKCQ